MDTREIFTDILDDSIDREARDIDDDVCVCYLMRLDNLQLVISHMGYSQEFKSTFWKERQQMNNLLTVDVERTKHLFKNQCQLLILNA